jgi:hypothetical protein
LVCFSGDAAGCAAAAPFLPVSTTALVFSVLRLAVSIATRVCSVVLILWQSGSLKGASRAWSSNWSSSPRLTSIRRRFIGFSPPTARETGAARAAPLELCAERVRQFEGASPLPNLMEVKG